VAIRDDLLPALTELLGPGARAIVATAVEAAGGRLERLDRRQVLYRPGRRASVRYAATVRWAGGEPVGESFVAIVDVNGPPAGTLVLAAGDMAVGLFRYPYDPALPGLRPAVLVAEVAARFDVPAHRLSLDVRTYRPGRRAVVRARIAANASGRVEDRYLKVVPPAELGPLVDRLAGLAGHLAVPEVLATWPDEGTAVLAALPGRTVRDVLLAGEPRDVDALPDGHAIVDLLDRMPAPSGPAVPPADIGPLGRAAGHAALLAAVMPRERDRLDALVGRLGSPTDDRPVVAVHGDLHEAQLLVVDGRIDGILDVDGAGPGRRVDDLGTLLGHLVALGHAIPSRRAAVDSWRARLEPAFDRAVDRGELRRTTAAALIGLATGPFRVQQPRWREAARRRIAAAEAWAAAAISA
jgi:hypothetical protein